MSLDSYVAPQLHTRPFGHGPRKALALHCSLAHSGAWRGVAQELADDLAICALDLPGHGRSLEWDGQGDLTDAVVAAVIAHLTEPMDLIGHSYGGLLAVRIALERPDLVRSLSLFEPVLMSIAATDAPELAAWSDDHMGQVNAHVVSGDPAMGARLFLRLWGDGRPWDTLPEDLREGSTRRIGFIVSSQPAIAQDNRDLVSRLGQIKVPVLVMDGGKSPDVMKVVQDGLAARIGNARRVSFEDLGHMGPISHPVLVASEIRKNIARSNA